MTRSSRLWLAGLAGAALTFSACGGNGPDNAEEVVTRPLPTESGPGASDPEGDPPVEESPAPEPVYANEWVVSSSGDDAAMGNASAPFASIRRAIQAAGPGDLIRVLQGDYYEKVAIDGDARNGTAEESITLRGEGMPRILPTSTSGALVHIARAGWIVEGFEIDVQGQSKYAVTFVGDVQGSTLRGSDAHSGSLGGGITTHGGATGAVIESNHIHHFSKGNDDSHGIVIQPTTRNVTIRDNDIHANSGDSIQCLGPEGYSSDPPAEGVLIEGNDLYESQENSVDIKTCHDVVIRDNRMWGLRIAPANQGSKGDAVVIHMSARDVLVEDNEIWDVGRGIAVGGNRSGPMVSNVTLRRNVIYDVVQQDGTDGIGIRLGASEGTRVLHNTIAKTAGAAIHLGTAHNGHTADLTLKNNLLDASTALVVGPQTPGLLVDSNLYRNGARFLQGGTERGLATWKESGHDARSLEVGAPVDLSSGTVAGEAVDAGEDVGLGFCGQAPDLGADELDC